MKTLIVYLPHTVKAYTEGSEGVKEIKHCAIDGNFWYWQVIYADNHWLDITAPCILEHKSIKNEQREKRRSSYFGLLLQRLCGSRI